MRNTNECWSRGITGKSTSTGLCKARFGTHSPSVAPVSMLIFFLPLSAGCRPSELINEACDLLWLIFFPSVKLVLSLWHLSRPWSQKGLFMWLKLRQRWSALAGWSVVLAAELNFSIHSLLWSEEADLGSKIAIPCVLFLMKLCFHFFPQTLSLLCTFLFPYQGPFLRVFHDYNWKSQWN